MNIEGEGSSASEPSAPKQLKKPRFTRWLADDPTRDSLRLLPFGPDRVHERIVRRQPWVV